MISEFLPATSELSTEDILAVRVRLTNYLREWWPELDTRPNSVFGDLAVTPMAVMLAGMEMAEARRASDLDLSRVARGIVSDPAFVESFLANFGATSRESVAAAGTIRLTFSENKTYAIDADATFSFGDTTFKVNSDEGNPVVIYAAGEQGRRVLVRANEGEYVVFLPVTGPPGVVVANGESASYLLPHPELTSVTAAGDFDPGSPAESLAALAVRARGGFPAAHFCSRSGVISFLTHAWPNAIAIGATITGDREMIRAGANILGVIDGAIDVFMKSKPSYAFGEAVLPLTWDDARQGWVGQLTLPTPPAFFALKSGIFQVGNYLNSRGLNTVYAKSTHPDIDGLGVAFSKYETLGVVVEDYNPQSFSEAYVSTVTETTSSGSLLAVIGQYAGHTFHSRQNRSVSIRVDSALVVDGLDALSARVKDESTGETAEVFFLPNSATSPTFGQIKKDSPGYRQMFNGLDLQIRTAGGTWDREELLNARFLFSFKGKTADFQVHYLYEPLLTNVDSVVNDPDNRPVQTVILARNFLPCHIDQFLVRYRVRFGDVVDLESARSEIFAYLNALVWPQVYDESKIGEIMSRHGSAGLAGVQKSGIFYPSLANIYVDNDGVETAIDRYPTTTLLPPQNDAGFGPRNVSYLVALETIQFNGTVI